MQGEFLPVLWCAADGERVPLHAGDGRYLDEHPVARVEEEVCRTTNDQVRYLVYVDKELE